MKRFLLAALLAAVSITGASAASLFAKCRATTDNNGVERYSFEITGVPSGVDKVYIEWSLYDDFSRVRNAGLTPNNDRAVTVSYKKTAIPEGDYYWRVRYGLIDPQFFYPSETALPVLHFTGAASTYTPGVDDAEFEPLVLDDGCEFNLSSVWLRSANLGNRIFASIDHPAFAKIASSHTFNHGIAVKDNIIYINRGSYLTSGWDSDKSRVWMERYSLLTGEELPMLWVYAPDKKPYCDAIMMPWMREDADGIIYFTNANKTDGITLYSVDIDGITLDTKSVTAKEVITVRDPGMVHHTYVTVDGSITSGEYDIWAIDDAYPYQEIYPGKEFTLTVFRWSVKAGEATLHTSTINRLGFLETDTEYPLDEWMFKIIPVGDDYFYMHGVSNSVEKPALSPMLMKFNSGDVCELVSCYGSENPANATGRGITLAPTGYLANGVSPLEIDGHSFIAYCTGSEKGTAARIVHTPTLTSDFSEHTVAWEPGSASGFATHTYQGLEARYLPDGGEELTGGALVLYLANGALGVYRVDTKTPVTVGLPSVAAATLKAAYGSGTITFGRTVDGITVYDTAGRVVYRNAMAAASYTTGSLAPGTYIVATPSSPAPAKIAVF